MKLPNITILDEADKRLREVSEEVKFPLSSEEKKNIEDMSIRLRGLQERMYRPRVNQKIFEKLLDKEE